MIAAFKTPLVVSPVKGKELLWELQQTLVYEAGEECCGYQQITVPAGFVTDFASIPRIFWRILLPAGLHREAACVHDWLYAQGDRHKYVGDAIFLEAMKALGVKRWKRRAMFYAVLWFGWPAWNKHRKRKP